MAQALIRSLRAGHFELCGGSSLEGFGLDELIEDGAGLDHCGTELFSAGFRPRGTHRDGVRRAVVFHHAGVVTERSAALCSKVSLG
jgi:hypothetical protein